MHSKNYSSPDIEKQRSSQKNLRKTLAAISLAAASIIGQSSVTAAANSTENSTKNLQYPHITRSIDMTSIEKVREFMQAKNIQKKQDVQFANAVRALQKKSGLPETGYLDEVTYEAFLIERSLSAGNEYPPVHTISSGTTGMSRQELGDFYKNYPDKNNLLRVPLPDPMSNNYYYGREAGREIAGTHLNAKLYAQRDTLDLDYNFNNGNSIQLGKTLDKRHFIAFIQSHNLEVLSYMTPGRIAHESPENTIEDIDVLAKSYISRKYGAAMPFAIAVDTANGIYIHARNFPPKNSPDAGGTYGCFGVPLFYQEKIFSEINAHGRKNFKIQIRAIY